MRCYKMMNSHDESNVLYAIDNRLYFMHGHKNSPTAVEQINRLPYEMDIVHQTCSTAKIRTFSEISKFLNDNFLAHFSCHFATPLSFAFCSSQVKAIC